MKKVIILTISLVLLVVLGFLGYQKYQEQKDIDEVNRKTSYFQNKVREIEEYTPEDLILTFMETVKNNEGFKNWDENMINNQIAAFYRIYGEEHMELCAEMISYQLNKCGEGKTVKVQVDEYINKLNTGKLDRVDSLILKCFNVGVESTQKQIEIESVSYYPY